MNSNKNSVQKISLPVVHKHEQLNSIDSRKNALKKDISDNKILKIRKSSFVGCKETNNDCYIKFDQKNEMSDKTKGLFVDNIRELNDYNQSNSSLNLKQNLHKKGSQSQTNDNIKTLGVNEFDLNKSRSNFKVQNFHLFDEDVSTKYQNHSSIQISKSRMDQINSNTVNKGYGTKLKQIVNSKLPSNSSAFFYKEYHKPYGTYETGKDFNKKNILKNMNFIQ